METTEWNFKEIMRRRQTHVWRVLRSMDYLSKPEGKTVKWIEDHSEGLLSFILLKKSTGRIGLPRSHEEMMSLGDQRAGLVGAAP